MLAVQTPADQRYCTCHPCNIDISTTHVPSDHMQISLPLCLEQEEGEAEVVNM